MHFTLLYNQIMFRKCFVLLWSIFGGFIPVGAVADHVRTAQENSPAVVAINVLKQTGATFTGTGFVLTPDGLIATNRHVIEDALYINITSSKGTVSAEAKPVAAAENVDLALLKIEARNLPTVQVVSSDQVRPGQEITVIGNPYRLQNTVSSGLISQVRKKANGILWHQISAPISPSSSGSPVFNEDGKVISVVFATYPEANNQNLNFSVPSDYLLQLVQQAGYHLPAQTQTTQANTLSAENPIIRHLKKSWEILLRLVRKIRSKDLPAA